MQPVEPDSFDDPALKKLCCFAWSKECCTKELCAKLSAMLAEESASAGRTIRPPMAFWQRPFAGVAAAAVVLIVSGVAIFQLSPSSANLAVTSLDPKLAADLIYRHDSCCAGHSSHQLPGIPVADLTRLGHALSEELQRPVLASAMPEIGWQLRGGAVCPVGKTPAAHLIFNHGAEAVSVFSLPRTADERDGEYQAEVNHHSVAGFVDARGTFFLVGPDDANMSLKHLVAIRDQMQPNVVMNTDYTPRESVAELLH